MIGASAVYALEEGGYDWETPAFLLSTSVMSYLLRQPSRRRLKEILSTYNETLRNPRKKSFTLESIVSGLGVIGVASIDNDLFSSTKIYFAHPEYNYTYAHVMEEFMMAWSAFESGRILHASIRPVVAFFSLEKHSLKDELNLYFKDEVPDSTSTAFIKIRHELLRDPKKALAKYVDLSIERTIEPSVISIPGLEEKLLQMYGENPLLSYMQSRISMHIPEYQQAFFNAAIKNSLEEGDVSSLSLLAVDHYLQTGSREYFSDLTKLIMQDTELQKIPLANGTKDEVIVLEYDGPHEPISRAMAIKISDDLSGHREKYRFHKELSHSKFVNDVLHLEQTENQSFLFDLRARGKFLNDIIDEDPELLLLAYEHMKQLQKDMSTIEFQKIQLEDKYLKNPLLSSKLYERSIIRTQEHFEQFGEYYPLVDFHVYNLYLNDDTIVSVDLENKGSGPRILEIVNLVDFSFGLIDEQHLDKIRNSLLKKYQEESNVELPQLESLYINSLGLRRNSYVQARKTRGYGEDISPFLHHVARTLESYTSSSQAGLANEQLEITRSILKTT